MRKELLDQIVGTDAPGVRWADPISDKRKGQLQRVLDVWRTQADHRGRRGPFDRVKLSGADVYWLADLFMSQAENRHRAESMHLEGAVLRDAHLEKAVLRGVHIENADLGGAHLQDADLRSAFLNDAELRDARLEGANLADANLKRATLNRVNLQGACLEGACLETLYVNTP